MVRGSGLTAAGLLVENGSILNLFSRRLSARVVIRRDWLYSTESLAQLSKVRLYDSLAVFSFTVIVRVDMSPQTFEKALVKGDIITNVFFFGQHSWIRAISHGEGRTSRARRCDSEEGAGK